MTKKHTYIDLFAGCGGLSLGMNHSGWKGLFAIEKSPHAFATLKYNLIDKLGHYQWPKWLPQKEHDINIILKNHKVQLIQLRGKVDLVTGGPPCQGFSTAGKRNEGDKRNGLIQSYINFIRLVQPKLVFFENVRGFTQRFDKNKSKGINYSEFVQKSLRRSGIDFNGYNVVGKLINFAEFGIPQKRTRFILVGIRKDICEDSSKNPNDFFSLIKSNVKDFLVNKGLSLNQNISEAISDLLHSNGEVNSPDSIGFKSAIYGIPKSKYQLLLKGDIVNEIPDSHRFANHRQATIETYKSLLKKAPKGKRISDDLKKEFNLKKRGLIVLDENQQAPTLTSHPDDYVHYSEPRILTVREYARIQSFPDWFEFRKKYTTGGKLRRTEVPRYTQVGNAIPPLFGEQAGVILKTLMDG